MLTEMFCWEDKQPLFMFYKRSSCNILPDVDDWPLSIGSYLLHPTTFHPRTLILNFSSLYFIPSNSSFLFNPHDFSFTNSSPTFYPTPCNPFQIICYISYPLNSYSSKWDLLFHTFNLIHNISSSSNHSFDFISLIWSCIFKT